MAFGVVPRGGEVVRHDARSMGEGFEEPADHPSKGPGWSARADLPEERLSLAKAFSIGLKSGL